MAGISYATGTTPYPADSLWDLTAKLALSTSAGGSVGKQIYTGFGDPNGVVTALNVGPSEYLDQTGGRIWWKTAGVLSNTGWY